jgi:outer membrane receptor protein involved in Fe transport
MRHVVPLLTAALLLGSAHLGYAQQDAQSERSGNGRVTGTVVDATDERPLQGATVAVRNPADSSLVAGAVTDSTGAFSIRNLPYDTYTVRISFVGFQAKRLTDVRLARTRQTRELGTITLAASTEQLDEVTVSAERPAMEVQTDRTVYNTNRQLVTAGGSARTVLNDLPSIQVDIDGSISYRGSEGVVVHINGEPTSLSGQSLASFLQSLSAASVERVEVIPNPSAKQEPEGAAGIINIVLKRNRAAGWSGGVTAGVGNNSAYNGSANLGYQSGPWRFFGNYGFRTDADEAGGSRFRRNLTADPTVLLDQSSTQSEDDRSHTLNMQAEYRPTDATTLSVETVFSTDSETQDERTNYSRETAAGTLLERFARLSDGTNGERSIDTRLSLQQTFGPDHSLDAELRFEAESESEEELYTERALTADQALGSMQERERDDMSETETEGTLEVDYTRPFGADVMLEAGYQGELRTQRSDQVFETLNPATDAFEVAQTDFFDYEDQTHALYSQIATPLIGNVETKVGLRAEQTFRTFRLRGRDASFDKSYFNVFPSAFLTYKPNEFYQARLSYSKRMRRPGTWQLDPVSDNDDPTYERIGNPQLEPEYVHSFELSFTRQWEPATLSITPFYRQTVNEIERREQLRSDGVTVLTFENFASSSSYGVELVTSLQVQDWVRGNLSVNANRVVTDASNVSTDLSNDAMAYSGRANLTFPVGPGLNLQVSQYYRAPMDIAGGEIDARMSSDVALQKELFDGQGSLSLRASDVFDAMNFNIERQLDTFYARSTRDWSQREVVVTFSYSFGGGSDRGGGRDRGGYR